VNFPHGWNLTFIPFKDVNERTNPWITQIQSNQQNFWQAPAAQNPLIPKSARKPPKSATFARALKFESLYQSCWGQELRLFRWSRNHRIRKVNSRKARWFGILPVATFTCRWQTSPNMRETAERVWRQMYLFWSKETCSWDFDDQTDHWKHVLEILTIKQIEYLHMEQMSKSSRFEQISGGFRFIVNVCLSYSYAQGREDAAKTCATHSLNSRKKQSRTDNCATDNYHTPPPSLHLHTNITYQHDEDFAQQDIFCASFVMNVSLSRSYCSGYHLTNTFIYLITLISALFLFFVAFPSLFVCLFFYFQSCFGLMCKMFINNRTS